MEYLNVQHEEGQGFKLTDFPDAVRVGQLKGEKAKELAGITLVISDLNEVSQCLELLIKNEFSPKHKEIVFHLAVVSLLRSYSSKNKARQFYLDIKDVLKDDFEGQEYFKFYRHLRDKHIAHDENSLRNCDVGFILNPESAPYKIEKIITFSTSYLICDNVQISNLKLLTEFSLEYCRGKYDILTTQLTNELEAKSFEELSSYPELNHTKPSLEDIGKNRLII